MFFPFIEGVNINNQPQFDESEVSDRYKLTQKQRYYERQIRKAKKSLALAKEVGDIDTINRYKRLVSNRQARLRNFISANNLARHRGREQIYSAGIKDSLKTKVKTLKVKSNNVPSPDQITKILREKDIFEKYDPTKHGEVTQALYDALGLAGKPTVVKKIPSNYQLQLRGIPSDDKYKIFKQLKEGDMWSSAGTSGNGINLGYGTGDRESNRVTIPAQFATRGGSTHGIVATAALTPDAKRISFEKLDELIEDFKTSRIKKELIEILEEKANAIKPFSIPDRSEAERAFKKKEYYLTLANLVRTNERSVVALVNGYDAIDSNFWTETTVINRTKLIIEEDAIEITPENSKEIINMLFAKLGIKR